MPRVEDKIEKAKQIYYRRNGLKYRGEMVQTKRGINIWFLILVIVVGIYAYQNKDFLQSEQFSNKVKGFLNTPINYKSIKNMFELHKNEEKKEIEENTVMNETIEDTSNIEEIQSLAVIWPVNGTITSGFGNRESTDSRVGENHTGIDIAGNERRTDCICNFWDSRKCFRRRKSWKTFEN